MKLPFRPETLTDGYGYRRHPITGVKSFHTGADLAPHAGAWIHAIHPGTVKAKRWDDAKGNTITVDHGDVDGEHVVSKYWHMRDPSPLKPLDVVTDTTRLGRVGDTGTASRGDHVHLEIWINGAHVDPITYLANLARKARNA